MIDQSWLEFIEAAVEGSIQSPTLSLGERNHEKLNVGLNWGAGLPQTTILRILLQSNCSPTIDLKKI